MLNDTNLTDKQLLFATEYIKTANATQAALKAGYSENSARQQGSRLLSNANVSQYIQQHMESKNKTTIATADEVLEYLTSVVRGEEKDAFGLDISVSDRTKAAELLGKRYMLFADKVKLDAEIEIDISDRMKQARVKSDEVQQGTTD